MESLNKLKIVNVKDLDKSNVFVMVDSNSWRSPSKISIKDLIDSALSNKFDSSVVTIHHDTSIFIIQKEPSIIMVHTPMPEINYVAPNVFSEPFINQDISIYTPPKNASELSAMHMMTDDNYLYVWTGNRWKRTLLSIW